MQKTISCIRGISLRCFNRVKVSSDLHDYDIVINPNPQLFGKFMVEVDLLKRVYQMIKNFQHGSKRFDFKAEDYSLWKGSWGDGYRLGLFFLKGTDHIVFSFHTIQYKSLVFLPDFRHLGMAWIPEKYRGKEILKVVTDYLIQEENMKKQNMLACNVHWSQNFWHQATGKSDISACTYYISYYEMSEFRIPELSKTENDVVVKTVNKETVNDVLKYDRAIFPFDRRNWMKSLFLEGISRIAYDSNGKVIGVGCLSIYPSGECVISPLYADEERIAQMIFRSILEETLSKIQRDLWRIQVRSNDQCRGSFEWIEPFLKTSLRRSHLSNLCYSMYPPRHFFDFSKVFVNAHPTNGPC